MDVHNWSMQSGHSKSIGLRGNSLSFYRLRKQIFCPWFYRLTVTLYLICFSEAPWDVASKSNIQKHHWVSFHEALVWLLCHHKTYHALLHQPTLPPLKPALSSEPNYPTFKARVFIIWFIAWGFPLRGFHCFKPEPINTPLGSELWWHLGTSEL